MANKWLRRKAGDWYIYQGGREVAWAINRSGKWWWSVPQAQESGEEKTLAKAQEAAEKAIERYG